MRNTGLDEAQAGIKIARRNINHLRYADDSTLMVECEEELKRLLVRVKEDSEKAGLKLKSESEVPQSCPTLATPWTAAHQAPPSMGFSRQEYWSRVPSPSPYMQSTSCEILGWLKHKLESRLPGEISTTSDKQMAAF